MDKLESLTSTLSQITMYDIKSMYNQAKNVVLNVSEMEAKVREATNEDPWGASSTLMQEIAQGTFSFQHFNEIMPCIYARFMEKEAKQWRQIYKALQLLEYLIKHGSERVVDDARSHISTIKMLRNFHYIDEKGKDEGINVRNRSRELVELLADVEKIRSERRKAKANKNKYVGVGNDGMSGMSFSSGGGRYGGFGNDSMAYSGGGGSSYGNDYGSYSGGGGGSSARGGSFSDRRQVEEYDAGDDETITRAPGRSNSLRTASLSGSRATPVRQSTMPTPAPAAPVPNLLDLDDDVFGAPAPAPAAPSVAVNKALPKPSVGLDDDDFDDFQAAPVQAPAAPAAPVQAALTGGSAPLAAAAAPANRNLMDLLNASGPVQSQRPQQPPVGMGMGMGSFGMGGGMHRPTSSFSQPSQFSSPIQPQPGNAMFGGAAPLRPTATNSSSFSSPAMHPTLAASTPAAAAKPAGGSSFDDLWSMSLGGSSSKPATPVAGGNKSIQDLQKEKANANLWGGLQQQQRPGSNANAFGAFGAGPAASSNSSGGDDLLL